jgi:hypothetical protein
MVGTLGRAEDNIAQVSVTALHGDISIRLMQEKSRFATKQAQAAPPSEAQAPETNPPAAPPTQPASASSAAAPPKAEVGTTISETDMPKAEASAPQSAPTYDSQLAVLQALSAGQITVEEAGKLLRSLDRPSGEQKDVWGTVKSLFHTSSPRGR